MRILIAEDEPNLRQLLKVCLTAWGYDVIVARNGNEAWQILQGEDPPRLVILDWVMPGVNGLEVCQRIRAAGQEPYTYIIMLTSQQREDDLVTGMEAGADDYITKPFKHNELKVRLRAGQRIVELQNELLAAREALRTRATHDPLTGLWNHGEILNFLGQELAKAQREKQPVSIIMADLDHFKRINDSHGHQAGDAVLCAIARRMLSLVRTYDFVGRYGGEEFLIILPDCDAKQGAILAERLRAHIDSEGFASPEGPIPVTISLGVASSDTASWADPDTMVGAADKALYRAKQGGRNRVAIATAGSAEQPPEAGRITE
ncbi:diguanylate cyclase response regulator [Geotalea uraniireducens]|uniref:diguanylate cyclase n=1 Tax=Geotalea uraniireducens TaxID=351604 RepID=A0ABN6VR64_9BACT|nr:diguanylate cyclase [Geotalea uraniireducens]BDV41857.1 diguanylate cyclase response regulator [Geotalea uraniireducens]